MKFKVSKRKILEVKNNNHGKSPEAMEWIYVFHVWRGYKIPKTPAGAGISWFCKPNEELRFR